MQNLRSLAQHTRSKRKQAVESDKASCASAEHSRKRKRTTIATITTQYTSAGSTQPNPIAYWVAHKNWPAYFFKQNSQTKKDLERDSWYEEYIKPYTEMSHLLARKRSDTSLRRKKSESGNTTPGTTTQSDEKPREAKSAPYRDVRYPVFLATKGSFLKESDLGITDKSRSLCRTLLDEEQTVPSASLFRDDLFKSTCNKIQDRNEALVIQDISRLIVPSAQNLAIYGAKSLDILIESVNEGWNNSIPVSKTRPQPDYAVGFKRDAFTPAQFKKLEPFIGNLFETSFFLGTFYMYFPFFTCEVKCGAGALDIADRQNAHSMTLAVRGVVELFRLVKRDTELHREILAFSVSHDHRSVRIYGHYAEVDGDNTKFYRYPVRTFDFTELDGRDKWTAYKFTKSIYNVWMPKHFERICSAVDQIPKDINFEVSQSSELRFSESTGFSQQMESSALAETKSQLEELQEITPDTSVSKETENLFKRPKKRPTAG